MNPYAKIGIKIGVVIVICLLLMVAYKTLAKPRFRRQTNRLNATLAEQTDIQSKLNSLLQYEGILPQIRQVQYQDMQMIRNLVPEADQFVLTSYLRLIHRMLQDDHLETDGISISHGGAAIGYTDFNEAFTDDITQIQEDLETVLNALDEFENNMDQMDNMLVSFDFYSKLSTGQEAFQAIAAGIETHTFMLTVKGSYTDIKKFTFDIFNMRPHTALVNFQMRPAGEGAGQSRQYVASFALITYGDKNLPPPLWVAKEMGISTIASGSEEVEEESGDEAVDDAA